MHEYERTATIPGQRTYILRKLKRKYGKVEVSCIESGQSNQYLLPNLGNHIAKNGIQAQADRCPTMISLFVIIIFAPFSQKL